MNIIEAKKTRIVDYLNGKGINPTKETAHAALFLSPFRNEHSPSFKVDLGKNVWYDFGIGEGGDVIALVKKMERCDISKAVQKLSSLSFSFDQHQFVNETNVATSGKIIVNRIQELKHPALTQYIQFRAVSLKFARKFVQEGTFSLYGRQFFALAFCNDQNGYELRNRTFKGSTTPKFITTIPGNSDTINIFEGFMDYLSACTHFGYSPVHQTIILNSVAFLSQAIQGFKINQRIHLYLDNDPAGRKGTETIFERFTNVTDFAPLLYPDHKDFNDMLKQKPTNKR